MGRGRVPDDEWPICWVKDCGRPAAALELCKRHHAQARRGVLNKAAQVGQRSRDWYGQWGILAVALDKQTVQCHVCGWWYAALGAHLRRHNLTAAEYRQIFGLGGRAAAPLAAPTLRERRRAEGMARVGGPGWEKFAARRDETLEASRLAALEVVRDLAPGTRARKAGYTAGIGRPAGQVPSRICAEPDCDEPVTLGPTGGHSRRNRCDAHQSGRV